MKFAGGLLALAFASAFTAAMPSTRTLYLGIQGGKVQDKDGWPAGDTDAYCSLSVNGQTKTSPKKEETNNPTFNWFNQNFGKQGLNVQFSIKCTDDDGLLGTDNIGSKNGITAVNEWRTRNSDSPGNYRKIDLGSGQYMYVQVKWELVVPDPPPNPGDQNVPGGLQQTTSTLHEIGLKWSSTWKEKFDGGSDFTGWEIQYKLQGTSTWGARQVGAATTQFTLSGLKDSDKYDIRLAVKNKIGWSAPSGILVGKTTVRTNSPTPLPTHYPTNAPSPAPTPAPTTTAPTPVPSTAEPTRAPTLQPTHFPTCSIGDVGCSCTNGGSCDAGYYCFEDICQHTPTPTMVPSWSPTAAPTVNPSTINPTAGPTESPTSNPTSAPSFEPTFVPTLEPTTLQPSSNPTVAPIHFTLIYPDSVLAESVLDEIAEATGIALSCMNLEIAYTDEGQGVVDFDVESSCLNSNGVGDAVDITLAISEAAGVGESEINSKMEVQGNGVVLCSDNTYRASYDLCPSQAAQYAESEANGLESASSSAFMIGAGVAVALVLLILLCWRRAKLRKKRRRSKYDVAPRAADAEDGDLPGGVRLSTRVTASPSGSTGGRRRPSSSAVREDVWAGVSSNALVEVDKLLQTSTSSTSPRRNGQEGLPDDTAADFSAYQPGGRSRASPVSSPRTSRPAKLPPLAGLRSQGGKGRSSLPVQGPNGSVALMTSRTISHASQEVTENFENNFSRMSHRVEQDRQRQLEKIENLRAVRTHIAEVNKAPLQRPMLGKSTPQRMLSPPVTSYDWEEEGFARPPSPP